MSHFDTVADKLGLLRVVIEWFTRGRADTVEFYGSIFSSNRDRISWQLNLKKKERGDEVRNGRVCSIS